MPRSRSVTLVPVQAACARLDFAVATEADACNEYGEFNPLALAHYAEYVWPGIGEHRRYQ